jgi:hypothetical protein
MVAASSDLLKLWFGLNTTGSRLPLPERECFVILSGSLLDVAGQELLVVVTIGPVADLPAIYRDASRSVLYAG